MSSHTSSEPSGYIFCTHCNEYVSETTFRRHMNLLPQRSTLRFTRKEIEESSSSDEDGGSHTNDEGT